MKNAYDVIVSGAGPTGLMLSLWLQRKGCRVLTVDKAEGLTEESRALGVQARTMETYDMLGIGAQALARGRVAEGIKFWSDGRPRQSIRFENMGEGISPHPYLFVLSQDQNEKILYEALSQAGGQVEWQIEFVSFETTEDRVTCLLRDSEGGERKVTARYLCGCDGGGSPVRKTLLGDFPGHTYQGDFYVADLTTTEEFGKVNLSLRKDGLGLLFPMVGERRARLIGDIPNDHHGEKLSAELLDQLARKHFRSGVTDVHWSSAYKIHHRVARTFHEGRVFLLGDAAHIHSPVGGQGMNTGLMDATNLGWKLAAVLRDGADPELLDSYAAERVPFARRLVNTTDRLFGFITSKSPLVRLFRYLVVPTVLFVAKRLRSVRTLLFKTISQTNIQYRSSPLSREGDTVGGVRAGDRLPWVPYDHGDNFAPLVSCDWQIHVYGEGGSIPEQACGLPVHRLGFNDRAQDVGLDQGTVYLIRPDGYVGLVLAQYTEERLRGYLQTVGRG